MRIQIHEGLPFITVSLHHRKKSIVLNHVLIDTGSAGSIFDVDECAKIDLLPEPNDPVHTISGVGGSEFVVEKEVDCIQLGSFRLQKFPIEIGAVEYGLEMQGILGFDFLLQVQALIDLSQLEIYPPSLDIHS